MSAAIKIEELSKIYRLGEIGTGTISRDLERWYRMKILKQEDPFLKIGEENDRSVKGGSDLVYSLKNLNLEFEKGVSVGIIGKNGAGKSTLLKIISRVTNPTKGRVRIKGRVASLLEVGTGFHPELTGRENIFLNGAILGMRKKEINHKLDEIIDFSGVERYIDTPVKRYSSGMYVRLAFAVAAHLESEILVVDEVLAVGDAEFQRKCLGKMGEVSKGEGRTVLFVSHNMGSIINLCQKAILLERGSVKYSGDVSRTVELYNGDIEEGAYVDLINFRGPRRGGQEFASFICISVMDCNGQLKDTFGIGESILIRVKVRIKTKTTAVFGVLLRNSMGVLLHDFRSNFDGFNPEFIPGEVTFEVTVPEIKVYPGSYTLGPWIQKQVGIPSDDYISAALKINIVDKRLIGHASSNFEFITKEGTEVYHPCNWRLVSD